VFLSKFQILRILFCLFLSLCASTSISEIVFGPENFMSQNGELTTVTKTIDLGDNNPGQYLIKIQNGLNGPALLKQCQNKATIELKRQCQYDNLVDRAENKLTRANRLFLTINGQKVSKKTIINKGTSYLEFPIQLNQSINTLKFEIQGSPESVVSISIEDIQVSDLSPRALFTINSNHGKAPFKINFNAALSFDPLNSPISYTWFVDQTEISTEKSGTYTLNNPGIYNLKLKVKNAENQESELAAEIVVLAPVDPNLNKKPIPQITVSYPYPLNLRKVQISSDGSMDTDGMITSTQIDFGDGYKILATNAIHEYANDGTYLAKVKVTDDLNAKSTIQKSISVVLSNEMTSIGSVFGPVRYYGSFLSNVQYLETITVPAGQVQDLFKIKIKNADGMDHPIVSCTGTLAEKIMCQYNNWVNRTYMDLNRVNSAQVYVNNKKITDSSSLNKNKFYFETYLTLTELTQMKIILKGWPTAYIEIEIDRLGQQADTTAPVLTSDQLSNTRTNNNLVHISISDNSNVTTEIYKDTVLQSTTTQKEFDLTLAEGINNFTLKSIDSANNRAADFSLNNIILDQTGPMLNSTLLTEYIFSTYPQTVTVQISANEDLSSLTVNGVLANMLTPRNFSYILEINQPQTVNLNLVAVDLLDNVTSETFSPVFGIDQIPPTISTLLTQNQQTNQPQFGINIVDQSNTITKVYINNVLQISSSDKQIAVSLLEGLNQIRIQSSDIYNNQSVDVLISDVLLDTHPPVITTNIKDQYDYKSLPFSVFYEIFSSEPLSQFKLNGHDVLLSENLSINSSLLFETTSPQIITIDATDRVGNRVVISKVVTVNQDNVAPEIVIPQAPSIILTSTYLLNIQINDTGGTQTVVKSNNQVLLSATEKIFSVLLDFPSDETKNIQVVSTDSAGNQSQKVFSIRKDTSPLRVEFISPQPYGTYPSKTVQVRLRANKPLQSATLNTLPLGINADQISFGDNIDVTNEGQYTFSTEVVDIFGNTAQATITFEIKTRSVASWEYQECPAN
jgi:hypothetical protein